jgi:hypothetical protein
VGAVTVDVKRAEELAGREAGGGLDLEGEVLEVREGDVGHLSSRRGEDTIC